MKDHVIHAHLDFILQSDDARAKIAVEESIEALFAQVSQPEELPSLPAFHPQASAK